MQETPPRALRVDAERNRRRVLDAANRMFCERGLDVGVAEIAHAAGVGRATLFRNFPTKEHLIAAVVVERVTDSIGRGRAALHAEDPAEALFGLIEGSVSSSQTDRALFDALDDEWMANDEIRRAHAELVEVLDALLRRAQQTGAVRDDVSAVDLLMMVKGMCEAMRSLSHSSPDMALRQIDLLRAALQSHPDAIPLRGQRPTLADLEQASCSAQDPSLSSSEPVSSATARSVSH